VKGWGAAKPGFGSECDFCGVANVRSRREWFATWPIAAVVALVAGSTSANPTTAAAADVPRPDSIAVRAGDVAIRIEGSKMWTLSGIEYRHKTMAVEESAYGTILTIRNVGTLGSAHFLDVPGQPGVVEKEIVTHLRFHLDDRLLMDSPPKATLEGRSFRMERRSRIRDAEIESRLMLNDGVLAESARVRTKVAIDLRIGGAVMYAWTPAATDYLFGDDEGVRSRGKFLPEGAKPTEGGDKSARWMAVYDAVGGQGAVCLVTKQPPGAGTWLQFTDAPGVYRKTRLLFFPEQIMPAGFDGTFETATGFFVATAANWEGEARRIAGKLGSLGAPK
jgi:hypothetical protein